jgi:myosin heavy subunit
MPPEAVRAQPVYSEKVDCFSFGVVIVQILSRQFPKPGDRLKTIRTNDPQFPRGIIEVRASEVERRRNHISQIDNDQPLMLIANDCLKDDNNERPSAQQLLERVVILKESPEYIESARPVQEILNEKEVQIQEAQEQIRELNSDVETKEQALRVREQDIEAKKATIATLEKDKIELQQHMESQRKQYNVAIGQKNQTIETIRAEKNEAIEAIEAEKQNLQTKLKNEQQVHVEVIAERDQMIEDKEKLNCELQGVIRAKEERYHTELVLQQERHVQEIVEQAETISARENEIQLLHENMKRESEKFQQENQKCRQESKTVQQGSERVQQEIKDKFQQELHKKTKEIEVLQEAVRAENVKFQQEFEKKSKEIEVLRETIRIGNVKFQQEIEEKRREIEVLRETIRNQNVKFQQELLHCQQQHYEEIKEKNQLMTAITKDSQQPLLRGTLYCVGYCRFMIFFL